MQEKLQVLQKKDLKNIAETPEKKDAMNKYGIENFKIEELEQVDDPTLLSNKEKYWIKELNTWGHTGYNASKGGDGKVLYDYKEIIDLYSMGYSQKQVAQKVGCCDDTVSKVLKAHNIPIRGSSTKKIDQFDMAGNYQFFSINISFESAHIACESSMSFNLLVISMPQTYNK